MTDAVAQRIARLNDIKQTQERLKISRTQVFKLIASGQLRSCRIGARRLVPEQAIVDFINKLDASTGGA
jgi:excisionase family DNA binding protein